MNIYIFIIFSEKMAEPVKIEMVFVKEECGGVEVKKELVEEQDPLSLEKGLYFVHTHRSLLRLLYTGRIRFQAIHANYNLNILMSSNQPSLFQHPKVFDIADRFQYKTITNTDINKQIER